jgi:hypothetical protein
MLPLLHLDLARICQIALDFSRLDGASTDHLTDADVERACQAFAGHSFAYRDQELECYASETDQSLDQVLSHQLVYGFTRNPVKRKSLLWFGRRFGCVIITICDPKSQLDPEWMRAIPGFSESGSDFVGVTDRPYAYWDGHNFHRIYPDVQLGAEDEVLFSDLGNGFGWTVETSESEDIQEVLAANPDAWVYSIVPKSHEQIVTVNDTRCLLLHSRYREVLR